MKFSPGLLFITLSLTSVMTLPALHAAPRPATVLGGSVVVKRKNVRTTTTIQANGSLQEGDVVATSTGKASLQFADGSKVDMSPNSAIEITKPGGKGGGPLLRALNGRIGAKLTSGKSIATRTALIRVKGTEIVITVAPDGATTLEVLEGAAEFSNPCGQVLVPAGNKSDVKPGEAPQAPSAIPDVGALLREWQSLRGAWLLPHTGQRTASRIASASEAPGFRVNWLYVPGRQNAVQT